MTQRTCNACNGSGQVTERCFSCNGTGNQAGAEPGQPCGNCGGSRMGQPQSCGRCGGRGQIG